MPHTVRGHPGGCSAQQVGSRSEPGPRKVPSLGSGWGKEQEGFHWCPQMRLGQGQRRQGGELKAGANLSHCTWCLPVVGMRSQQGNQF